MFFGYRRQRLGRHLDVGALYLRRHRLASFEQGIAAEGDDDAHEFRGKW
jgi:hypothetical protein